MKLSTMILAGLGAGAAIGIVIGIASRRGGPGPEPDEPEPAKDWQRRIRVYAGRIEDAYGWTGFPDFLVAVARTESGGNPRAIAKSGGSNAARGWFGLRPNNFANLVSADELFDERTSVGLAAIYAYRLHDNGYPGQVLDWLAVRRGWALPRLVSDVDETAPVSGYADGERSGDVRERMALALSRVGLPESFMFERAFPPGFAWPGDESTVLGLARGAAVA